MTSVVFSPCSLVSTPWQARAWGDWDATHSDDQFATNEHVLPADGSPFSPHKTPFRSFIQNDRDLRDYNRWSNYLKATRSGARLPMARGRNGSSAAPMTARVSRSLHSSCARDVDEYKNRANPAMLFRRERRAGVASVRTADDNESPSGEEEEEEEEEEDGEELDIADVRRYESPENLEWDSDDDDEEKEDTPPIKRQRRLLADLMTNETFTTPEDSP